MHLVERIILSPFLIGLQLILSNERDTVFPALQHLLQTGNSIATYTEPFVHIRKILFHLLSPTGGMNKQAADSLRPVVWIINGNESRIMSGQSSRRTSGVECPEIAEG